MDISEERYFIENCSLNIHEVAEDLSLKHSLSKFLLLEVDTTYERDQTCKKLEEWFLRDPEQQKIELLHFHKLQEIVKRTLFNIPLHFFSDDLEHECRIFYDTHIGSQALKTVIFNSKHKRFEVKGLYRSYHGEIRILKEDYRQYVYTKRRYSCEELIEIMSIDLDVDEPTIELQYLCWIVTHHKHSELIDGASLEQKQLLKTFDPHNTYEVMGIPTEKAVELYKICIPDYVPRRGRPKVA
jgi:hypothetical protein